MKTLTIPDITIKQAVQAHPVEVYLEETKQIIEAVRAGKPVSTVIDKRRIKRFE